MKFFSVIRRFPTRLSVLSLVGLALIGSLGCNNNKDNPAPTPDTVKPHITVLHPTQDALLPSGTDMQIEVRFSDDRELSQAKFTLHFDDGHFHKATPIDTQFVVALSGKEQTVTRTIKLTPEMAAGPHHFIVECLDKTGNQADFVEIDLEITSPLQPVLSDIKMNDQAVSEQERVYFYFNDQPRLENRLTGTITAATGGRLEEVKIRIYADETGSNNNGSTFSFERSVLANNQTSVTLDENITFPADKFKTGDQDLLLHLTAKDQSGHIKIYTGKMTVRKQ